jgi:aminopeptidase N
MSRSIVLLAVIGLTCVRGAGAAERERPYRASAYDVELEVDPAAQSIVGNAQLTIVPTAPLTAIDLDCSELVIDAVSADDAPLTFEKRPAILHIVLPTEWQPSVAHRLRVRYHGRPRSGMRFFADGWYTAFTTQGWLPCDADPAHKATLTLQLTTPAALRVYATGERGATARLPDGRQRARFVLRQPYSAYLFGMVAGRFAEHCASSRGVAICAAALPAYAAELPRVVQVTTTAFAFFADHAGIAYPFAGKRYEQLFVPGSDVAQEAAGMTVLGERYLGDMAADPHEDWSVVHELSHQWWGNWVTARAWDDFWLNEGLTTFLVAAAKQQRWGALDYQQELALARRRYARALAKAPRAIVFRDWQNPGEMGGAITYSGGALVLDLLRRQLGDAAFWNGLRRFTRAAAGQSVASDDLRRAMEAASGVALQPFFDQWLYHVAPALTASDRQEGDTVVVALEQTAGLPLRLPIDIAVETARGRQQRTVTLSGGHTEARFAVGAEPVLSLRLDAGGQLPIVIQQPRSVTMLSYQLLHEPDVAGRVEAATQLEQACAGPHADAACARLPALVNARLHDEPSPLVRSLEQDLIAPETP